MPFPHSYLLFFFQTPSIIAELNTRRIGPRVPPFPSCSSPLLKKKSALPFFLRTLFHRGTPWASPSKCFLPGVGESPLLLPSLTNLSLLLEKPPAIYFKRSVSSLPRLLFTSFPAKKSSISSPIFSPTIRSPSGDHWQDLAISLFFPLPSYSPFSLKTRYQIALFQGSTPVIDVRDNRSNKSFSSDSLLSLVEGPR